MLGAVKQNEIGPHHRAQRDSHYDQQLPGVEQVVEQTTVRMWHSFGARFPEKAKAIF
jgi:hypothetical protein